MPVASTCPKCGSAMNPDEKFCGKCGYQVKPSETEVRDISARIGLNHEKQTHQQRIKSGRTTILVVSILMMLGAALIYFFGTTEIEKVQRQNDAMRGNLAYDQA